jgi:GT2 family glycosyltransferase
MLTWNSDSYIDKCLQSIINSIHLPPADYEIFIVDNGSTDQTRELIRSYQQRHTNIKSILLDSNTGTTYPRNLALKESSGEYIAVMDSDMEINADTFSTLITTMQQNQNAGLVAPKLIYGSGALQKSTDQFPTLLHKIYRYFFLKKMELQENKTAHTLTTTTVDYAISAFWLFRRELLDRIGLLDEKFFYAPEDVDFCLRVWQDGQQVLYVPESQAIHYAQELSRGLVFNKALAEHLRGMLYFFSKHRYLVRKPTFTGACCVTIS